MHDIKRILVVSRMTKYCRKAVHYGISLSRCFGAELYVIHVVHDPLTFGAWNLPKPSLEEDYKKEIRKSKEDIDACIIAEKGKGMPIKELIKEGDPSEEILAAIKENNIDLAIMLAHEEWRLEHFLFGRSNEEMTRKMPCSILLLKEEPQPMAF
ncbi:MAG TPA: universal stress protein [Dissulfurispiraceae bacterium]|nr:universal stress protein [Dissulfurispiraceae bacterium]